MAQVYQHQTACCRAICSIVHDWLFTVRHGSVAIGSGQAVSSGL